MSEITYSSEGRINLADLQRLLGQTSWAAARPPDDLQTMLDGSRWIAAWRDETLVGFARAVTDGVYRALLEDVVVDESLRGQGVGQTLVERLLDQLAPVQQVLLVCGDHLVPFYGRFGFQMMTLPVMQLWKG